MSNKSSSTTKPSKFAKPYITAGANALQDTYNANKGGIQSATDSVTSLLPAMVDKYKAGDSGINAAREYNTNVLRGQYLDQGNPYLDAMIANSNDDIRNQVQAALGARGLTGGSDYTKLITDRVARNTLGMRYQDYASERDRMATAAGQSPSIAAGDAIQVAPMLSTLNASLTPLQASGAYAGSLGGLLGNYTKTTQSQGLGSTIMGNLSNAAMMAAMASDVRLKEDIRRVGQTDGGLPVYTYRYKGDPKTHMGVMAQDVEIAQPEALGPVLNGYKTVLYGEVR